MRNLKMVGSDGLRMFALSLIAAVATLGVPWLRQCYRVFVVARRTTAYSSGPLILVLGQKLHRGEPTHGFKRRLDRAADLFAAGSGTRILILGGYTGRHGISEAAAGRDYLMARGIPAAAIQLEDRSRHTLENLRRARDMLPALGGHIPVLITCRFHLARTSDMAGGLGLEHRLCAAEARFSYGPVQLLAVLREGYFLHWYWVGRRWSEWTGNRANLNRIT